MASLRLSLLATFLVTACGAGTPKPAAAPVERDETGPKIALAIVVDRSGSMTGLKLETTLNAARAAVASLGDDDLVTVITFDTDASMVVRLQRVGNHRADIAAAIATIQAGGGTNIYPALDQAYQTLAVVRAPSRHVILLSDGQAPYDGIPELAAEMKAQGISVSTIGIGDADRNLMNMIAEGSGGRLYMVDDLQKLDGVFVADVRQSVAATNGRSPAAP